MPTKEFWIQLENRAWDVSPRNIARMTGQTQQDITGNPPILATLTSPETGVVRNNVTMFRPVDGDALILRRYTEGWAAPDDRKVNPWDLNEPDPTDNGTMGTIPGPTIECNIGDKVVVYFRNKDFRIGKAVKARMHSLHPHGIVFPNTYDGAYPLSPKDPTQPIPAGESAAWSSVGVTTFKQGDRVPPNGTFTYTWDTFGWPSTAGVWHYHDHSICDVENVLLGAIGFLVIHNPDDPEDVVEQDLPGDDPNGPLTRLRCFDFPFVVPTLPQDLVALAQVTGGATPSPVKRRKKAGAVKDADELPVLERTISRGDLTLELAKDFTVFTRLCLRHYVDPPRYAQYLQYYHEFPGAIGMCINGRKYLGNTPTFIAGPSTKMRFGLAAMNNLTFHTFHLHGHRWTIPGPNGDNPGAIQTSPQVTAVSQFEDTKIFGPANSFSFTINQGSFMGSRFGPDPTRASGLGEWHMHCHVLNHMMPGGMMGSLLVIQGGEIALSLPVGELCPAEGETEPLTVELLNGAFSPTSLPISVGDTVTWVWADAAPHSVTSDAAVFDSGVITGLGNIFPFTFTAAGTYPYHCAIHGAPGGIGMSGVITVT